MATLDSHYWNGIYEREERPGWDMDRPTPLIPELLELASDLDLAPGPRVAVPGCGYGHDAMALKDRGFQVEAFDYAPLALERARARYGEALDWRLADWFRLEAGPFDWIFDHTCFVAIEPARRGEYTARCLRLLRPGGLWLGACFHTVGEQANPPFAIAQEELAALLGGHGELRHLGPATRSHPRRLGRELLWIVRKHQTAD